MKKNLTLFFLLLACTIQAQSWQEQIKLTSSDRSQLDFLGAEMAMSGSYLIVSAPFDAEDANGENPLDRAGSVYIFERDGNNNWQEVQKLTSANRRTDMRFGLDLNIGGNYAIVGSPSEQIDGLPNSEAGIAYVFARDNSGEWKEAQKLVPSDGVGGDNFGEAVAINNDYAVVGAYKEAGDTLTGIHSGGSVYIFKRLGDQWIEKAKITANDIAENDGFGVQVAISGKLIGVLSPGVDTDENGENFINNAGAVYLFSNTGGDPWFQKQKIVRSDRVANAGTNWTFALDENALIIGNSYGETDESGANPLSKSGFAHIFSKMDNGVWEEVKKLVAPDREEGAEFGNYVSISGKFALVGSPFKDAPPDGVWDKRDAGSVYIFERDLLGNWDKVQSIMTSDQHEEIAFGNSVAISGNHMAGGAPFDPLDSNGANSLIGAGAMYVFEFINVSSNYNSIPDSEISVQPNPGRDVFQVIGVGNDFKFKVIDLHGRVIKQGYAVQKNIDLSLLEKGMYFLTIPFKDTSITKIILIQ